jgi:uncharacterized protein YlxP (DUF503 family)
MSIGFLKVILIIEGSNSLKQKRMVLHSLKAKLRNSFNVAVAQIADEDKWQKSTLAIVGVERDNGVLNSTLSEAVNFIESFDRVQLVDYEMEML